MTTYFKFKGTTNTALVLLVFLYVLLSACDKNNNFSLFSIEDDRRLGLQVSEQIASDPQFIIAPREDYPEAYAFLDSVVEAILSTGEVVYRDEFVWELTLLRDDQVLNAFAAPGGYIYVYTGLLKFLDCGDDFAGVMAHEIAHADLRHTSRNLRRQYGVSLLLQIITGEDPGELATIAAQIAGGLSGLQFSREFETEADERSVEYLAKTGWACDGAAHFFEKLEQSSAGQGPPEFLSTHPSPDNRIVNIGAKADEEGCDTVRTACPSYRNFLRYLP